MPIASKVLAWEYNNSLKQLKPVKHKKLLSNLDLWNFIQNHQLYFWNKLKKLNGSKMSAESEFTRDKEGFLQFKDCSRRFLTAIG